MKNKKLFNLRPFVFIGVGIMLGIISAYFFYFQKVFLGIVFLIAFIGLNLLIFINKTEEFNNKSKAIICLITFLFFVLSGTLFYQSVYKYDNANLDNHYFTVKAKIVHLEEVDLGKKLVLNNISVNGVIKGNLEYKSYLYVSGNVDLDIGDYIEFSTYLKDKFSIYENKFSASDIARKIKYTAEVNADEILLIKSSPNIFEKCNIFIRNSLKSALSGDEFAVAYALLTGNGEYMSLETISSYRFAGVAHIFAVSGLHIGFLAVALNFIFDKLRVNKFFKTILITLMLLFYSGICSFSSSSIRAVIMTSVMLFSSIKGKRYDPLTSISIAFIIILILFPVELFCVGFQLSFIVVLGMLLLTRPVARLLKFLPKKVANSLAVVLSAQISSIPISLNAFGYFSPIAVMMNLIFLPVVSVIFIFILLATVIGGIFNISAITLFIPKYVLMLVNMCINAIDFEGLLVTGIVISGFSVLYYLTMLFLSDLLNIRRLLKTIICVILSVTCVVGTTILTIKENNAERIYAVGSNNLCCTIIETNEENVLVVSGASHFYSNSRLKSLSNRYGIDTIDTVIFLNEISVDEQVFLTKLRTVFSLKKICYYGEKDNLKEQVIKSSFGYDIFNFSDNQNLSKTNINCVYVLDGKALEIRVNNKNILVFGNSKNLEYDGLRESYDFIVTGKEQSLIFNYYKPKVAISYLRNASFLDGESLGTAVFDLK